VNLVRLFAEALENTPPQPAEAIRLQGGYVVWASCYGTLPNLFAQLLAYILYRWENNIRMASVLGFVGAGGADALCQPQPVSGGSGWYGDSDHVAVGVWR
jgi:ABC-type phosphate/phosphonate transport system permease subunit